MKNNFMKNIKYVYEAICEREFSLLADIFILSTSEAIQPYIWVLLTKYVVDNIQNLSIDLQFLGVFLLYVIAALVLRILATKINCSLDWKVAHIKLVFNEKHIDKALSLPYKQLENEDTLNLFQLSEDASSVSGKGVDGMIRNSIKFLTNMMRSLIAIYYILKLNALFLLITSFLLLLSFKLIDYTIKRNKKEVWDRLVPIERKRNYLLEYISSISYAKEIRIFSLQDWIMKKFIKADNEKEKLVNTAHNAWIKTSIINNALIGTVQMILIYLYLVYIFIKGLIDVGELSLYLGVVSTFTSAFSDLLRNLADIIQNVREVDDLKRFLEIEQFPEKNRCVPPSTPIIRFCNVSFKYPNSNEYALEKVDIEIPFGQRLAIIGKNGAGKTTFIKLLLRLYEPTEGKILLNDIDISTIDKNKYYSSFSTVFQDPAFFAFSVEENITLSEDTLSDISLEEILKTVGFDVASMDSAVFLKSQLTKTFEEEGLVLSGGQLQKLSLARALYKSISNNSEFMILDEPTSALDPVSEMKLYNNFDKLIGGRTGIFISHRLASIKFCDKVAVFNDGKIVEYGEHKDLIDQGGLYCAMFKAQSNTYT